MTVPYPIATYNVPLKRGSHFSIDLTFETGSPSTPVPDIESWSALFQVRAGRDSTVVLLERTNLNGIALGPEDGHVRLSILPEDMAVLGLGEFVYELRLSNPGDLERWFPVGGILNITEAVAR